MSDQCHSTVHGEKAKPGKTQLQAMRRSVGTVNGMPVWRSIDELADTPEFREHLEKEFPHGALELQRAVEQGGENRRDFLKIMGGSLALAGIAAIPGCRQPDHKILPYAREVPEDIVIGKPLFYATSMARPDGGAEGLLVETHEGRPTKIEGNPLHPTNNGKASMWALASIMSLYDPDRLKFPIYKNPVKGQLEATWDDFRAWAATHFAGAGSGEGLAFVVGKASSPSLEAAKATVLKKFPKAVWSWYAPTEQYAAVKGAEIAFGKPMRETLKLDKSTVNVIVSLDRDFLYHESEELVNARGFASTRGVWKAGKGADAEKMSRLYAVESGFSITGAAADHRLAIGPSRITGFAVELAKFILPKLGAAAAKPLADVLASINVPAGDDFTTGKGAKFLAEAAKDLLDAANRDKALVLVGHSQPAEIHALGYAINAALGSVGKAQVFQALTADEASNANEQFAQLAEKVKSGAIKTLVTVNANPVFDAPGAEFAAAFAKIPATITLSVGPTETAAASTWALNGAHYLECWGDTRATDGTISPVQPMIAPLYDPAGSRAVLSDIEFLALIAGGDMNAKVDGYEIIRSQWKAAGTVRDFESAWRHALHDGIRAGTARGPEQAVVNFAGIASALAAVKPGAAPSAQALDVAFVLGHPHDGRFGNIAWLHELPEVATRTVWDNPVLMSPATAEALGVLPYGYSAADPSGMYTKPAYPEAQMVNITVDGKTVAMPAWILPGMAENTLIATFGYGRSVCGRVGDGVGVNVAALRPAKAAAAGLRMASGATVVKANATYPISSTQNHWTMEGRTAIVRAVDLEAWNNHGAATQEVVDIFYGSKTTINFAERLGELSHTPPKLGIYANPYNAADDDAAAGSVFATGQQWAMTIDQSTCTGCGACTLACQSENNIPVVGKKEVAKGREMTWIRVDRYFTGDFANPDAMFHQPVACVHCENAPCEVVCPVNATVHGPEGLNYMTYNRCIGTRYCANNCPYKVRRYNFFEYGKLAFNGDYIGKETVEKLAPERGGVNGSNVHNKININLIPPRLRDKISQIEQMQKNPNVTVRMRGVMEKCSYCIQRINESRIESKLHNLPGVPDGFFQVACQQACPSNAIVFGDMLDTKSKVHATKAHARSYALLGYLNTRPRTSHMVRVMNPNPALCDEARKHSWEEPFHHGDHGGGHDDGHGGGHGDHAPASDGHGEQPKSHAYIDSSKRSQDGGYAMSLKVLGASF
jgi:molybdopterin-containing oxidoreductase family iron-sulfur binding subunit